MKPNGRSREKPDRKVEPPIVAGRPPPHDLDAEAAVLSALLLSRDSADQVLPSLRPEHFYSDANGRIYQAIVALGDKPADIVTVRSWLDDRGLLQKTGGPPYLHQLADATPAEANVGEHAKIVREKWRVRQTIATCQRIAAAGYGDVGDVQAYLTAGADTLASIRDDGCASGERASYGLSEVFTNEEPTPWLCEGLQLCPGRAPMFIGYGGGGKTYAAVSAMIAIVYDRPVWGCPDFRPSRCEQPRRALWADFELGVKPSKKVLRKLLRGMKIGTPEIQAAKAQRGGQEPIEVTHDDALLLKPANPEEMDAELRRIISVWTRRLQGFDFALIDSLRKLAPWVDERDPAMGNVVDALRKISEATGCVILLLHHSVKGSGNANNSAKPGRFPRAIEEMGSGSGAIDAAAGPQFFFQKDGGISDPRLVTQGRVSVEADRHACEPFYLAWKDTPEGHGVEIVYQTRQQVKPPEKQGGAGKLAKLRENVLAKLRERTAKGKPVPGLVYLAKMAEADPRIVGPILDELVKEGLAVDEPENRGRGAKKPTLWALSAPGFVAPARPSAGDAPTEAGEPSMDAVDCNSCLTCGRDRAVCTCDPDEAARERLHDLHEQAGR